MLQTRDYHDASSVSVEIYDLLQQDGDEVLSEMLQRLLDRLESPHGFCGYLDSNGDLTCTLATVGVFGAEAERQGSVVLPPDAWTDMWGAVLQERRSLVSNKVDSPQDRVRGVLRCLATPILNRDQLLGVVFVANRDLDYNHRDVALLELLAKPLASAIQARLQRQLDQRKTAESISALVQTIDAERQLKDESLNSLHELQELHRQILDATPAVVYVKDLQGRYQFINRQFEEIFHVQRADVIGQTDFDLFPPHLAQQFRQNDLQVTRADHPLKCQEQTEQDGVTHIYLTIKFPLRDRQGQLMSVAGISTDITEQLQLQEDLTRLYSLHTLILDSIGDGIIGIDCDGRTTFVNPVASEILGWTEEELISQPLSQILGHVLQPLCHDDTLSDAVLVEDEDAVFRTKSGLLEEVRVMSRPLLVEGRPSGTVISFRRLADELLRQEREQRRREEERRQRDRDLQLRTIRALQLDMFPSAPPTIAGYEIGGRNEPRDIVSGDFFDFIPLADGSLVVVVGDATGHDLASAVHMVEAHAVLHTLFDCEIPLQELLPKLNQTLCRHLSGRFVSLFVLRLTPETGRIEFAGAGHDATVIRASGEFESLPSTGLVLGLDSHVNQPAFSHIQLQPGDEILLLTDGFQETFSTDRHAFGRKRILDVAKASQSLAVEQVIEHLLKETERHAHPGHVQDDRTAVIIRRQPDSSGTSSTSPVT
ncbi:MAG: SpoIIE family protein phosphatase [Planctomycetaceae bacterium]